MSGSRNHFLECAPEKRPPSPFLPLLDSLRSGKLDRIVVWRLDRLGRTTKGLCDLFDELRDRKADLVSIKDGFSLDSPAGRLHARILASVAEYENEVRRERVLLIGHYLIQPLMYACECGNPKFLLMGVLGRSYCFRCSSCSRLLRRGR